MKNELISKLNKIEGFLKNYPSIITFVGITISFIGLFLAGGLYYKTTHIETEIYNQIEKYIDNNIEEQTLNNNYYENAYIDIPEYTDYLSKAKLGDLFSQMWIAKYYKENGMYSESIYWYQNVIKTNSEYLAIAYNNLGWLFANGFGLSELDTYSPIRYNKAFEMFYEASKLGLDTAIKNAIEVAKLPSFCNCYDNSELISSFVEKYDNNKSNMEDIKTVKSKYSYTMKYRGANCTINNYHCSYSGVSLKTVNNKERTVYCYYCVIYNSDGQVDNIEFIYDF